MTRRNPHNRTLDMLPLFAAPAGSRAAQIADSYATDGRCHNAEPGTFNHKCGRPAVWIGRKAGGFESGFCDECKVHGFEARGVVEWRRARLI